MDAGTIIAVVASVASAAGGFLEGKRRARVDGIGVAADTVSLLEAQVGILNLNMQEKDAVIADLQARVNILESMVTQRAEVAEVHTEVIQVRSVVDRIAEKVGA